MPTQRRDEKRVGEPRQHGALVGDVGERVREPLAPLSMVSPPPGPAPCKLG